MINKPTDQITFDDLTETPPIEFRADIDKPGFLPANVDQRDWMESGVVYKKGFFPDDLLSSYMNVWHRHHAIGRNLTEINWGGWQADTPYLHIKELRDLCLYPPLMALMKDLIGSDMGVHLNLTGWVSTNRDMHQDYYLNPAHVGTRYTAVWIALEDIDETSGPFQFVPGSHKWPTLTQRKLFQFLTPEQQTNPAWPSFTQSWVAKACLDEINRRECGLTDYVPKKGDLLIWHSALIHRGSTPKIAPWEIGGVPRKALIAHYSALEARPDMPIRKQDESGCWYFYFDHKLR